MTYYDMKGPVGKIFPAIISGAALLLAGAFSISGVNAFGQYFSFGFMPLLVITLWPRQASALLSLFLVFFGGLFTDWASGGIIGQWALIFSVVWGIFRPELHNAPFMPVRLILSWGGTCTLAAVLVILMGWFVYGIYPDFWSIGRHIIAATFLLPIVLILRHVISSRLGENESWGR